MIIASIYPCPFDRQDRHEFNASILKDEEVYSYEEGKLTSVKNDGTVKFPERALMAGFKELNIEPQHVDKWVFPTPFSKIDEDEYYLFFSWFFKAYNKGLESFRDWFNRHVVFVDHQISHASLAVYGSGFSSDIAFLCMDGGGDFGDPRGYVFGEFIDGVFDVKYSSEGIDTIANFHSFITDTIGFSSGDNGKTSGLASYGSVIPELKDKLLELIHVDEYGITFDRKRFNSTSVNLNNIQVDMYNRTKIFNTYPSDTNILRLSIEYLPQDIAATGECVLQETLLDLLMVLRSKTNMKNIVFSGGLFQNVSLNNRIIKSKLFDNTYFPAAPSDSGLSLGGALYVQHVEQKHKKQSASPLSAYLGPSFSSSYIETVLNQYKLIYYKHDDISRIVAEEVSNGNTIGWFQGRAEFGPRSLGARSLIADPRSMKSKEKINQLLKKRDWFMPYAPSILEEDMNNWVNNSYYSPYMQVAFDIKEDREKLIPSAVHVDGTSRIHTVRKNENLKYWNMINEFKRITGVPLILNTSFNRHGISTISTPRQAVEHLLEGCMDFLAIGDYIVSFKDNRIINSRSLVLETEKSLLKQHVIDRLKVFNSYGTEEQFRLYLKKLSDFIGLDLDYSCEGRILCLGEVLSINDTIKKLSEKIKNS